MEASSLLTRSRPCWPLAGSVDSVPRGPDKTVGLSPGDVMCRRQEGLRVWLAIGNAPKACCGGGVTPAAGSLEKISLGRPGGRGRTSGGATTTAEAEDDDTGEPESQVAYAGLGLEALGGPLGADKWRA